MYRRNKECRRILNTIIFIITFFYVLLGYADNVLVNLVVSYKTVNFTGKSVQALAINHQIPAPTLHFKQGDTVTINVYNHLDVGTAIHWHGLIVPWQMDGVEGVTQKAIPPGGIFSYHFKLHQSGTYWYHAHAGFQEQQGLYGAFIVDPPKSPSYKYTKDYPIVLSDWSNTNPNKIFANLKKDGDYYSPRFPLQPSLTHFIQDYRKATPEKCQQLIDDYKMMQQMRMSIYDFSDVAYDAFLLNGRPPSQPWTTSVKVGDVVRLRFIGAGGSTIFHVKIPGAVMQIIHVEGNDVRPYDVKDFTIAPGETYDVLVKIKKNAPYIIYAESTDTLGAAVGALMTDPNELINYKEIEPFPEPESVTREMMTNMMSGITNHNESNSMTMVGNMNMDSENSHNMKSMPTEPSIIGDVISPPTSTQAVTTGTKYQNLIASVKTNDPRKSIAGIIRMQLFGYMDRYVWYINGQTESQAKPIIIDPGKRYRIIFTNDSMMHHPMHIHGHWFILRNGHGAFDPLLHTVDVPPGVTVVVDIDADASGQWFFHCHHLYHMMTGMARVFQYSTIIDVANGTAQPQSLTEEQPYVNRPVVREDEVTAIDPALIDHPMGHPANFYLASFLDVGEDPFQNAQQITFKGLYGGDFSKLELSSDDAEINQGNIENADMDIFYWHLISQFWAIKGGMNYTYRPAGTPYWQPGIGIEGLMPYFIDTNIRTYYHDGSTSLDVELSRDTQITDNFFVRTGIRSILATNTVTKDEIGSGLNQIRYTFRPYYRLNPGLNLFAEYEHDQDYGSLKTIIQKTGESDTVDTLTFGVALLF
jgi:FtsP/CotA-like multicopper oxidase with cupredoxin domain/uncharacterized protein involved in copper resistance